MKAWQGMMLTGAMCLSSLLSNAQIPNNSIRILEGDYINLDSAKIAEIKKKEYPCKRSIPITSGIDAYVSEQWNGIIYDFQNFFNVPIYSLNFEIDDLHKSEKKRKRKDNILAVTNVPAPTVEDELGVYWIGEDYVTISDEEKYLGYSLKTTKKSNLGDVISTNKFVRSVILHEIAHDYTKQTVDELRMEGYAVDLAFSREKDRQSTPNALFILEGIAEYCPITMGELIQGPKKVPKSIDDMFNERKRYDFYYCYSVYFLQDFLNVNGLRNGIRILLSNPPPTDKEILNPELYFSRLKPLQKIPESE